MYVTKATESVEQHIKHSSVKSDKHRTNYHIQQHA